MHVWQETQTGPAYMAHALIGQATGGYDYGGTAGLAAHDAEGLEAFNPEQQASIIQDYFVLDRDGGDTAPYATYIAEVRAA